MKYDYDVIAIGGGAAGLTSAGICANFGMKTLLIERHRLGGDCTWTGCIPSKSLLKAAAVAQTFREADHYGILAQIPQVDFEQVMESVRRIREDVYEEADSPEIMHAQNVETAFGSASFVDAHTIKLEGEEGERTISSKYFVIAAGASAFVPPIKDLDTVHYYTNENLFEISEKPQHLMILGGGPIGSEMAQAFCRLGTKVTIIDQAPCILTKEDVDLALIVQNKMGFEGVQFQMNTRAERVYFSEEDMCITVVGDNKGKEVVLKGDAVLVATGRRANVKNLNLEAAGVNYDGRGVSVNDRCRTNVSHIYAVGDITGRYQFTHMSEHMAKVAATNIALKIPAKIDTVNVPWTTFTDPEIAHVGYTEEQLQAKGIKYHTYKFPYSKIDRAIADQQDEGMIKIWAKKWNGKILGVSIAGVHGGELICEYAVAMRNGLTLRNIADTIHPYPSYGLGARRAADQWYVQSASLGLVKFLKTVFGYRGPLPDLSDPERIV